MSGASNGFFGQAGAYDEGPEFHVRQHAAHIRTNVPVKIIAVHGGGVGNAPTVDVQVLVKQSDGVGNTSSHSTIYGIPVSRIQGGASGIISDPVVGDTYHMAVHDRDISSLVKNGGTESNPGSYRRHDLADGTLGAQILSKAPTQYVNLTASNGITVVPKPGKMVFLGGDGQTGTYDFVMTASGPSINVKARIS